MARKHQPGHIGHTGHTKQAQRPPLPVIYPDADPHNENWLRILAQRRQKEQQAKAKHDKEQKENPANGDIQ